MLAEEFAEEPLVRADLRLAGEARPFASRPGTERGARGRRQEAARRGFPAAAFAEHATGRVAEEGRVVRLDRRMAFRADVESGREA